MKRVAIVQPNYIPWRGYFDLIASVDEFLLLDDVQYTKRDWRNRNLIKTAQGLRWLTIPVKAKGRYHQLISEVEISDAGWRERHWEMLRQSYRHAACFDAQRPLVSSLYERCRATRLVEVNLFLLSELCRFLGIRTRLRLASSLRTQAREKNARLIELCLAAGATDYVSGPAARAYLNESLFERHGLRVHFFDYAGYPDYPQLYGPFEGRVSVLDAVFQLGDAAGELFKRGALCGRS